MKPFSFFFLLLSWSVNAQVSAPSGQVYVWAGSGLNLRKTPDFKAEKIATLPYGTAVEWIAYAEIVKGYNEIGGDFEAPKEEPLTLLDVFSPNLDTYSTLGSWVKVRAMGKEGFVFDAYLSEMPPYVPPSKNAQAALPTVAEGMKSLYDYGARQWGILRSTETETLFSNGVFFEASNQKFEETRWVFPKISQHDGYLLANYFLLLEKKTNAKTPEGFDYGGYDKGGRVLFFYYNAFSNMELNIRFYEEAMIVISRWGGD